MVKKESAGVTMGRKSFLIMGSNVLAAMIGFVALTTMTRYVGDAYGSLMWAMAFAATFNAISDLGFSSANVKRISEGQDVNDCFSTFIIVKMALTAVMMTATIGFFLVYIFVLGNQIYTASIYTLLLFVLYWGLCNMSGVFTSLFKARKEISKSESIHLIDPLLRAPVIVIFALQGASATYLALAYVLGAMAMVLVGILLLRRSGIRFVRPTLFRNYLRFALPLSGIVFLSALLVNLDVLLLGFFWNATEVGYFASSYKLLELVLTFGAAINTLLFPSISEWHALGDMERIRDISSEAQRFISMLAMPIAVFLFIFAYPVAGIVFGDGFVGAGGPLTVMSLMLYIILIMGVQSQVIIGCNRPDLTAKTQIVVLGMRVMLLIVFVPTSFFGIPMLELKAAGAAMAGLVSWIAYAVIVEMFTRRIAGISIYRGIGLHIIGGGITALAMVSLAQVLPMTGFLTMLFLAAVTMGLFLTMMFIVKELRRNDIRMIANALDPRKMLSYIREEIGERD